MPHWVFRSWIDNAVGEEPKVGEPYWDAIRSRLGIASTAGIVKWFMFIRTNGLRLSPTQNLTGMLSDTVENPVVLDFKTSGEIRVIDTSNNNNILARFTTAGALFTNASITGTAAFGGIVNKIVNGPISILRSFPGNTAIDSNTAIRSALIAPNWHLWCSATNGGALSAVVQSTDVPANCSNAINVTINRVCYAGGLRTFIHSINEMRGRQITFSVNIKGPVGGTSSIRILSDSKVFSLTNIVGDGNWHRYSIPIDFSVNTFNSNDTLLALDTLYCPKIGTATNIPWGVAGTQANVGMQPVDLELRSREIEKSLVKSICHMGKYVVPASMSPSWDILDGNSIVAETDSASVVLSNVNAYGGTLTNNAFITNSQPLQTNLMAYKLPFLLESA